MLDTLKRILGSEQQRKLKYYEKRVQRINAMEDDIARLTDDELRQKTLQWKEVIEGIRRYKQGIEAIQEEAFAVVREASKRVLGKRHYDVQLIGGFALLDGNIAEMPTGEGKTLVASLPSYVKALEGQGVHVITVNEYLARRDFEEIGKIHEFLGLTVGLNVPMMDRGQKAEAYQADITYGLGNEFGFDYLRDNLVNDMSQKVQRPYHFAIIDEVDSVLIDESKTPLIIAAKTTVSAQLHHVCAMLARRFEQDVHFTFDLLSKTTNLTDDGIQEVEKAFGVDNLYDLEHQTLYHYTIQALRARVMFKKDVDYIVKDDKILLVDMFTGRVMEGRTLSDGLHQAIEAKEKVTVTEENKTTASITVQNYYRMYPMLAGMTGTAKTEEKEFRELYGMDVIQIPTNRPIIRKDNKGNVFLTKENKYTAMLQEVKERHEKGQPVLVGTTSIIQSEEVASYLDKEQIPYQILNAKSVEQEVEMIANAGQLGQITIATNMAGRGTDILLGDGVAELGGLFVLGTERHESRRIDNQLKGRSGRQGDPGESTFFVSVEDDIIQRFASEELEKKKDGFTLNVDGKILNKDIYDFIDRVQRISEGSNYSIREYTLKLDDVINEQRNVVYQLRDRWLASEDLLKDLMPLVDGHFDNIMKKYCAEDLLPEEWDLQGLNFEVNQCLADTTFEPELTTIEDREDLMKQLNDTTEAYKERLKPFLQNEELTGAMKRACLSAVDHHYIRHLEQMTRLKEGISMRRYQQEDPMRLYQNDGFELFTMMYQNIERDVTRQLAIVANQLFEAQKSAKAAAEIAMPEAESLETVEGK
ncbi:accessory Sec system translocase SecA2 [Bacillaceae bacterium SIJ1]|uniref:accessory Sec system translocase SecA2 n=1 Tax=Litoribacterium kuwaitense TaxID=1398745 RepID=UPI0013EC1BD7|nr:accessory Sec system translocase SecA2 [Litoribacterium kuwaitense]NGP44958.1 accessory Sec system translocase SecA2 [Litoribacterium kuwaitense]